MRKGRLGFDTKAVKSKNAGALAASLHSVAARLFP